MDVTSVFRKILKAVENPKWERIAITFLVYLNNYCYVISMKRSPILLLLDFNKKSHIHVIWILQRRTAILSCSLALCFFGLGFVLLVSRIRKNIWVQREIGVSNWYLNIIFSTYSQMAQGLTSIEKCLQFCMEPNASGRWLLLGIPCRIWTCAFLKEFSEIVISNFTISFSNSKGF